MKTIELDEELYRYIASHTQHIGESASDILRRMLKFTAGQPVTDLSVSGAAVKVTAQPAHGIGFVPSVSCCCPMNMQNRVGRLTALCWYYRPYIP